MRLSPNSFHIRFIWIPSELGGRRSDPYSGMRVSIRWQRNIADHLRMQRDVQCLSLEYDPGCFFGAGEFCLKSDVPVPDEWLLTDELIEFVDGFRVVAVGKLIEN